MDFPPNEPVIPFYMPSTIAPESAQKEISGSFSMGQGTPWHLGAARPPPILWQVGCLLSPIEPY